MLWLLLLGLGAQSPDRIRADELYRAKEYEQAARIYFELWRATPNDDEMTALTGRAMVDAGHSRQALLLLTRAAETKPDDRIRQTYLARALVENNRMLEAENILARLTREDPQDPIALFYFGSLRYQNGYYPAALTMFDRLLALPVQIDPGILKLAQVYRASTLTQLGRAEESEPLVEKLLTDPALQSNLELLLTHAQILFETGRLEPALAAAGHAIRANGDNAQAHAWKARILARLARWSEAESAARQALLLKPDYVQPHTILLEIYRRTARPEDAAREAEWLRASEARKTQP